MWNPFLYSFDCRLATQLFQTTKVTLCQCQSYILRNLAAGLGLMGRVLFQHMQNPGFWSSALHKLGMVAQAYNSNRWAQEATNQDQDQPGLHESLSQTIPGYIHTYTHTKNKTCKLKPNPAMTSGNWEQPPELATWKRSELLCWLRDKSSLSAMCLSPSLWSAHWVLPNCKTMNKTTILWKVYFNFIHMCVYNYISVHVCAHTQRPEESIGTLELEFLAVMSHLTSINSGPCKNTKHS